MPANYVVSSTAESAAVWAAGSARSYIETSLPLPDDAFAEGYVWVRQPLPDDGSVTDGHVWFAADWPTVPNIESIVKSVHMLSDKYSTLTFEVA